MILTILALSPIAVGALLLVLPQILPSHAGDQVRTFSRNMCMGVSLGLFAISTWAAAHSLSDLDWMAIGFGSYELENTPVDLIPYIGVSWHVGADALSLPMIWLTSLVVPISMLVEWDAKRGHLFHPLLLVMEGAMIGVFVSLDLFVFYVFWELTLIPMFFLILMWGGADRRYAAMKFFIYTFTASVIMLIGILVMYFNTGTSISDRSFDLEVILASGSTMSEGLRHIVWMLLLVGFATKMPSVPVHTWLPDAHVQAPTAGSMILAGVMLKMGAYGFLRVAVTAFPGSTVVFTPLLVVGSEMCIRDRAGALFMMFAHGIISPLLFAVAGAFKHHYHTLEIGSMRGIAHHSPWLSGHMMLGWMASLGLPMMAGFVAEVAVLIAFWMTFGWLVLLPALTLIITAVYYLTSMQRTIFESNDPHNGLLPETLHGEPRDITWHENAGMAILGGLTILFGILPFFFWDMMSYWSSELIDTVLVAAMESEGVKP